MIASDAAAKSCLSCRKVPAEQGLPFCAGCLLEPALAGGAAVSFEEVIPPGTVICGFLVGECLGAGGFAEVYSVTREDDPGDSPPLALKLIRPGMNSREVTARFGMEQRVLRNLEHDGIVRIESCGITPAGRPFFAMEQVDGLPVTEYCQAASLPVMQRMALFAMVCDAVQHAHQKAVLHRDLKPSNILVAETPGGPQPKVIDFGIAKALEPAGSGETLATRVGEVLGTPSYISPEQAGGTDEADTRSDIYSLGAVLYEMLTGSPPWASREFRQLPAAAWPHWLRESNFAPPSVRLKESGGAAASVRQLSGDADKIVMKAMAAEPGRRYASAAALAEDVRNWMAGNPVSARAPSLGYQLSRFVRRYRWQAAAFLAVLATIITATVAGFLMAARAREAERLSAGERDKAVQAESAADVARERADRRSYQAAVEVATMQVMSGEPFLAAEKLRNVPARLRGWEWGYLISAAPAAEASVETGLPEAGRVCATADGKFAAAAENGIVHLADLTTGKVTQRFSVDGNVERMALSADGSLLAIIGQTGAKTGQLTVIQATGGQVWDTPLTPCLGADLAWAPDGALIVIEGNSPAPAEGRIIRFERDTGRILQQRPITRYKVGGACGVIIGDGGDRAVVRKSYKELELIALPELTTVRTFSNGGDLEVRDYVLDEANGRIVVGSGPLIQSWSLADGKISGAGSFLPTGAPTTANTGGLIDHLTLLPGGKVIARSGHLLLREGPQLRRVPLAPEVTSVAIGDGRRLSLLAGGRIEIRPAVSDEAPQGLPQRMSDTNIEGRGSAFTPDGLTAVYQGWDREQLLFLPVGETGVTERARAQTADIVPPGREAEWSGFPAVHPDGSVMVPGKGKIIAIHPRGDARGPKSDLPAAAGAWSACASADGSQVAFGMPDRVLLLDWKTKGAVQEWPLKGAPFQVFMLPTGGILAWSAEGVLHVLSADGTVTAIPVMKGTQSRPPVAFHPAGRLMAVTEPGKAVDIYDLTGLPGNLRLLKRLPSADRVTALAISPDTRRLVSATKKQLTVWDWQEALPLIHFPVNNHCSSIGFSPDGKWLVNTEFNPSLTLRGAAAAAD